MFGAIVGALVGVAVGALLLILAGPTRSVRAETGMDDDAESRVLLTYYPEGDGDAPVAPVAPAVEPDFSTGEIRALTDLADSTD